MERRSAPFRATGFDLRAVGWVVTYDTCADIVSIVFGRAPRLAQYVLRELAERWSHLEQPHQGELPTLRRLFSSSAPLEQRSARALETFVQRLIELCPDRYNVDALRRRCVSGLVQACIGCALGIILGRLALSEPSFGPAALVLLAAGLWSLLGAVQLWRTYRIAKTVTRSVAAA